jgi:hypothetical protein
MAAPITSHPAQDPDAAPGWYPDPEGGPHERWRDTQGWGDFYRNSTTGQLVDSDRAATEETAALELVSPVVSEFCGLCGKSAHEGDRFCRGCGAPVSEFEARRAESPVEAIEPNRSRRRRVATIAGSAALVIAAAAAALILLRPADPSPRKATVALRSATVAFEPAMSAAYGATRLADVVAAGRLAGTASSSLATSAGAASAIDTMRYRAAATRQIAAERHFASDLARLATVDKHLAAWPSLKESLQRDVLALQAASPAFAALHLHSALPLTITTAQATRAVTTLDAVLTHAQAALTKWLAKTRAVRARNRQALQTLVSYEGTMNGYLAHYDSLRTDLSDWISKVDDTGATFDEAYQKLGDAESGRMNLKDTITHLKAPAAARAAQNGIVEVLSRSITAIDDASSGIADYQYDAFQYDFNYKNAPGWKEFESGSASTANAYAAARAAWQSSVRKAKTAVRRRDLPPRPVV